MCTLVFAWQQFADAPVAVAANRDERYERTSTPPSRLDTDPRIVAPRDGTAGGTWIGYNDAGLFTGITNRWVDGLTAERSRGLLVRDALAAADATTAVDVVETAVADATYDGFNLLVADEQAAYHLVWDGTLTVRQLHPGVHVLVNVGLQNGSRHPSATTPRGVRQAINARGVRTALQPTDDDSADQWLTQAATVLSDHEYGVCLHNEEFGTVSTSLIQVDGDDTAYDFAAGPPCETSFERVDGSF